MLILSFSNEALGARERVLGDASTVRHESGFVRLGSCDATALDGDGVHRTAAGTVLIGTPVVVDRQSARARSIDDVATSIEDRGEKALAGIASPFRFAAAVGDSVFAAADHAGLAHLYTWQGDGIACVSSSSVVVGQLFKLGVDSDALAGLALMGSFIGQDSAVIGVRKVAAGDMVRVSNGRVVTERMPAAASVGEHADPNAAIVQAVLRCSSAAPDADVELSGGFDSRMVMAALARADPSRHGAFTIGHAGDADVELAKQISRHFGMRHVVVDTGSLDDLAVDDFAHLLREGARHVDYGLNPIDRVSISHVARVHSSVARLGGQNGELVRGFYYPGQRIHARPSDALARRLIAWRIFANDRVERRLLRTQWYEAQLARLTDHVAAMLLRFEDEPWGYALDHFYLEQRMQRWCGAGVTSGLNRRLMLLPFFDSDVVAAARNIPLAAKRGSAFAAAFITEMDPFLADLPLDNGLSPRRIARADLTTRAVRAGRNVMKVVRKVRQRVLAKDKSSFGSATASGSFYRHRLYEHYPVDRVASLGILEPSTLKSFAAGEHRPSRSGLGFLLNAAYLTEDLT